MDATLIQASLVLYARLPLHVRHIRVNLRALECLNLLINRIFQEKVSNVHAERDRIRAERHKAAIEYEKNAPIGGNGDVNREQVAER